MESAAAQLLASPITANASHLHKIMGFIGNLKCEAGFYLKKYMRDYAEEESGLNDCAQPTRLYSSPRGRLYSFPETVARNNCEK